MQVFFQMGKCSQTTDHVKNHHSYKHICNYCFGAGKRFPHPRKIVEMQKRSRCKKRMRHCNNAVLVIKVSKDHIGQGPQKGTEANYVDLQCKLPIKSYSTKNCLYLPCIKWGKYQPETGCIQV